MADDDEKILCFMMIRREKRFFIFVTDFVTEMVQYFFKKL